MSGFASIDSLPRVGPAAVCLGVFDGVHLGHRALVEATSRAAVAGGLASVGLLFDPPPIEVIRPGISVPRLAPPNENLKRLAAAGIDHPVGMRFTERVRDMAPEAFLAALAPGVELRALVLTPDSAFGKARSGTPAALRSLGARAGFEVVVLDELTEVDGAPVSSSRIRGLIVDGDIDSATRLLGRAPYLAGIVVHGDARGRDLGYPTANLRFDYTPARPPNGIYIGRVAVPGRAVGPGHPALVSIGVRPTFGQGGAVLVEVHLLDFDGDLYGSELRLDITARLRDELRFEGVDALVTQMHDDERRARELLGA